MSCLYFIYYPLFLTSITKYCIAKNSDNLIVKNRNLYEITINE